MEAAVHGHYGKYGDECPYHLLKILEDEELQQWCDSVDMEEVMFYRHCQATVTVPKECREQWKEAFYIPLHLWKAGQQAQSLKLHWMFIRMLAAPVLRPAPGRSPPVVKVMKERLSKLFSGDWRTLWEEAEVAKPAGQHRYITADQLEYNRHAKATHLATAHQFKDAKQALTGAGLLSFSDPVLQQFDELFQHRESPDPEPFPDEMDEEGSKKYTFELGQIWIVDRQGEPVLVPTLPHVLDHRPTTVQGFRPGRFKVRALQVHADRACEVLYEGCSQ